MNDHAAAEHGFDTPGPTTLVVAVRDGSVDITAADVTTTTVHVSGSRADEARVEQRGGRILVVDPKPRGFSGATQLHYAITVPSDSQLIFKGASARVTTAGRLGTTRVKSASGDVALGDLSGTGVVDTASGSVALGEVAQAVRIRSGSGRIRLGGSERASISTGSGDVRVEHATGRLSIKTGSGDIRIGVTPGTPVWTDILTGSGRLTSDLPQVGEPERGAPYVEIRAVTGSGDVALVAV